MTRHEAGVPPSPFRFFPANEDNAGVLTLTGDMLAFIADALLAWDPEAVGFGRKSMAGLSLLLEACNADIQTVADRLDADNAKSIESLRRFIQTPP